MRAAGPRSILDAHRPAANPKRRERRAADDEDPAGRFLPGLAALGLLTAFLVVLVSYEAVSRRRRGSDDPNESA
ncbi:hypothetical protein [Micromonospora sp. NPDC000668]|uniref:hypothetical protein n=1 Tax=Micromonospora sp. NPDC000668 TaxID=3364219 RepID=UPI0036A957AC